MPESFVVVNNSHYRRDEKLLTKVIIEQF